ncbi:uncharacterized protein LOC101240023 [Hydra vulgaris]|uniref:Uncharacterized protein LOC101240023 n=1 Tax=Hydra vulgaris TaxID=6087 RepID=A0ABM4BFP8_HYDVU
MHFLDLNTDCLMRVLRYLDLDSLINVSQINEKLLFLVRSCCSINNLQQAIILQTMKTISQNFNLCNIPQSEMFRNALFLSVAMFHKALLNKELLHNWIIYDSYLSSGVKKLFFQSLNNFLNISDSVLVLPARYYTEIQTFFVFTDYNKTCILTSYKSKTCSHLRGVFYFMEENKQEIYLPCKICSNSCLIEELYFNGEIVKLVDLFDLVNIVEKIKYLQCNQISMKCDIKNLEIFPGNAIILSSKDIENNFYKSLGMFSKQPGVLKLFNMLNLYSGLVDFCEQIQFYNKIKLLIHFYSQANFIFHYGEVLPYLPILEKLFLKTDFIISNCKLKKVIIHFKLNDTLEVIKLKDKLFVKYQELSGSFPTLIYSDDSESSYFEAYIIEQFEEFVTRTFTDDELKNLPIISVVFVSKFLECFFTEERK